MHPWATNSIHESNNEGFLSTLHVGLLFLFATVAT